MHLEANGIKALTAISRRLAAGVMSNGLYAQRVLLHDTQGEPAAGHGWTVPLKRRSWSPCLTASSEVSWLPTGHLLHTHAHMAAVTAAGGGHCSTHHH